MGFIFLLLIVAFQIVVSTLTDCLLTKAGIPYDKRGPEHNSFALLTLRMLAQMGFYGIAGLIGFAWYVIF